MRSETSINTFTHHYFDLTKQHDLWCCWKSGAPGPKSSYSTDLRGDERAEGVGSPCCDRPRLGVKKGSEQGALSKCHFTYPLDLLFF